MRCNAAVYKVSGPMRLACWIQGGSVAEVVIVSSSTSHDHDLVEALRGAHLFAPISIFLEEPLVWNSNLGAFETTGLHLPKEI